MIFGYFPGDCLAKITKLKYANSVMESLDIMEKPEQEKRISSQVNYVFEKYNFCINIVLLKTEFISCSLKLNF